MRYVVEPGTIGVMIGASSADIRLRGTFVVVGEKAELGESKRFTTTVRVD